jgi:hypothetical protein
MAFPNNEFCPQLSHGLCNYQGKCN